MSISRWRITDDIGAIEDGPYKLRFSSVVDRNERLDEEWTHFGFFEQGPLEILHPKFGEVRLPAGGFFRCPGGAKVYGRRGFLISLEGSHGFLSAGGPFSEMRTMRYPPGGEQNCLIWPAGPSLASLNYLTLTSEMGWQKAHRHPSLRFNVVLEGKARYRSDRHGESEIKAGDVILIHSHEKHAFGAAEGRMTFVAFHPDSAKEVFFHSPMPAQTVLEP